MKKVLLVATGILTVGIAIIGIGHLETRYTRKDCFVLEKQNNLITVLDKSGHYWNYYSDEQTFELGDKVDLKMHTNGTTEDITDDLILKVVVK